MPAYDMLVQCTVHSLIDHAYAQPVEILSNFTTLFVCISRVQVYQVYQALYFLFGDIDDVIV